MEEKFQNKLKMPKLKKAGPREDLALLFPAWLVSSPFAHRGVKFVLMIGGKGTAIATMVKEGAVPVWRKCYKSRPVLEKPRDYVSSHSPFIHKSSLNQQA